MISLSVRRGMLGDTIERFEVDPRAGISPRSVVMQFEQVLPKGIPIHVCVDGVEVDGDELDQQLRDGQHLVLAPATTAGVDLLTLLIYALVSAVVSLAVNYLVSVLTPKPKPPGLPQQRGDEESPTYSWEGVRTSYGPGLPIAWAYGQHALGGQAISIGGFASVGGALTYDRLDLLLALAEGEFHEIAGVPAAAYDNIGPSGQFTPVPQDIFVNETRVPFGGPFGSPDVARVWIRPGTLDQVELTPPFVGASVTASPNVTMSVVDDESVTTFTTPETLSQVTVVLTWPGGLYSTDPTGNLQPRAAAFDVFWRASSSALQAWSPIGTLSYTAASTLPQARTQSFSLPSGTHGPIDVRVRRATTAAPVGSSDTAVLRNVSVATAHQFAYPGVALLGLTIQASAFFSGGYPQVKVRCKASLVRVWDATHGFSEPTWDIPAAPFDFMSRPPGRNPAWCLADFLTQRKGLGSYLTDADVDWPAFRRWAAFCDTDPNPADPWGEAGFCVDLVGDVSKPAWEWVLTFASAGRATPVWKDGKVSVVYQYRDAHGDAGITVPAKTVTQLFTTTNVQGVQVNWLPKHSRPTVLQFQFLNEDANYNQDVIPVEDVEGSLNDPSVLNRDQYIVETIQAYGVTRPAQLWREGRFQHRMQRQIRREIVFTTGPWALAAEVGDLIDFQHDLLRPFAADVPQAGVVLLDVTTSNDVLIDHPLSGSGLQIAFRTGQGAPIYRSVVSYVNAPYYGREVAAVTVDGAPLDLTAGTECVVGLVDKLTETYQIVSISLQKDLRREVRAVQWVPEVFDPLTKAEWDGLGPALAPAGPSLVPDPVTNVTAVSTASGQALISWGPADNASEDTQPVRVFGRLDPSEDFRLLGETTDRSIESDLVRPGRAVEVSIVQKTREGNWTSAADGAQATIVAEEFQRQALPTVTGAAATTMDDGLLLKWDDLEQRDLDYYEVRAGSHWPLAQVLYRGRSPRVLLSAPHLPLQIAPRSRSGLYGERVVLPAGAWAPAGTVVVASDDDLAPSPAGTHSGTQWNAGEAVLELQDGVVAGTYTSVALDAGYQAPIYWTVAADAQDRDLLTVDEAVFELGSGEALWRTVDARPASPYQPGHDWQLTVDEAVGTIDDSPGTLLVGGHTGEPGTHSRVLVETRFEVGGVWSAWLPHSDRIVVARKMQVRLTLNRATVARSVRVTGLAYSGHL